MTKLPKLFMLCLFGMISMGASAIPNNTIYYTSWLGNVIDLNSKITTFGDANIVSNEYSNGQGIITFDKDVTTIGELTWVIWQGEQSCGSWDGVSLRFSDSEGKLPTLSDETYDWMVGKKMCVDISAVNGDGTTIRVTNGWWSTEYVSDTEVHAGDKFVFEFTQDMADECKNGKDLLFVSNNGLTITKFYYEYGTGAFYGCSDLKSVLIPNSVTSIGESAFEGCSGLSSIEIPNSVTSIGDNAFSGCTLYFVNNSSLNAEENNYWGAQICDKNGLIIEDNVFVDCAEWATTITIPNSVTTIGDRAFEGCLRLTSVTIPNSVTSIGSGAFSGCSGLTSVNITDLDKWAEIEFGDYYANPLFYAHNLYLNGQLVTEANLTTAKKIGSYAFNGYSNLISLTIPNSVTSIGIWAFSGCSGLSSIEIPKFITSIEYEAFAYCSGLTSIKVHWKRPLSISDVWYGVDKQNCTLYVPEGTWAMYCSAHEWMDFVNIEEFSEEPGEEIHLAIMGVNGVILQQAVEIGKTYKYLLDNKKNGKIVSVTFNGEDVTADVTDGKYTTPKITGNSEIYVEYDNQPKGDINDDGVVDVADITATAKIILSGKAKREQEQETYE